ncbi:MAG: transcription elongation factor GreA [Butyricicoccus sp.]|nr:transcription elongation factor GreA [Butyricicoccus sp.]
MKQEFKMTQESLDKLKEELEYLNNVRMREITAQIKEALSFGDLSENAEYHSAKDEQGKVNSRIIELEEMISKAVIIAADQYARDEVSPGCSFKIVDVEFNEEEEYRLVGSQEADPLEGLISDESPVGKAVLGHKVGDIVEVEAPGEAIVKFKITEIIK